MRFLIKESSQSPQIFIVKKARMLMSVAFIIFLSREKTDMHHIF